MKITAELKFWMQFISFIGIAAALRLITFGVKTPVVYAGLLINTLCLVHWVAIRETDEEPKE